MTQPEISTFYASVLFPLPLWVKVRFNAAFAFYLQEGKRQKQRVVFVNVALLHIINSHEK